MVPQYYFKQQLQESKKKLIRKLDKYTPEQRAKIRDKMLALGKENGGWYDADEYGARMHSGQLRRAAKMIRRAGMDPTKTISKSSMQAVSASGIVPSLFPKSKRDDAIMYHVPGVNETPDVAQALPTINLKKSAKGSKTLGQMMQHFKEKSERKAVKQLGALNKKFASKIKRYKGAMRTASNALVNADIAAHEGDELSQVLKIRSKIKSPIEFTGRVTDHLKRVGKAGGSHMPKVLDREVKRAHMLRTMYGDKFRPIPRSHKQFAVQKKSKV